MSTLVVSGFLGRDLMPLDGKPEREEFDVVELGVGDALPVVDGVAHG